MYLFIFINYFSVRFTEGFRLFGVRLIEVSLYPTLGEI